MRWLRSFKSRILFLVVIGGVLPLVLVGLWITGSAARAGEQIVRDRLSDILDERVEEIAVRWTATRSQLLTLVESEDVQEALRSPGREIPQTAQPNDLSIVESLTLYDASDQHLHTFWTRDLGEQSGLPVFVDVYERGSSVAAGSLVAELSIQEILSSIPSSFSPYRYLLTAVDPASQTLLLPMPFSLEMLESDAFEWGGDDWLSDRRVMTEPAIELVAAAPLSPMSAPFEEAASRGMLWLFVVALTAIAIAYLLTDRMTQSLARLSLAADSVSRGELDTRVERTGKDEIGKVASAFNDMTESLQHTMRQLADRQALAAVGEFAASLSHEIRNALTAIRLDMQVAGETIADDSAAEEPHQRALGELDRLNETVSTALRIARSGKLNLSRLDLWDPLYLAVHAARPEFEARGIELFVPERSAPIFVHGDATGIEQCVLNLLLNASQATPQLGRTTIRVERIKKYVLIHISDTGTGIPEGIREKVFEAFYSTRDDGTGLGLPIARRIAQAHGGHLRVVATSGEGTTIEVRLPLHEIDVTK